MTKLKLITMQHVESKMQCRLIADNKHS